MLRHSVNLAHVVSEALKPFNVGQVHRSGPSVEVSAKHALSLTLALHELATNAIKYGALSTPEGGVAVTWSVIGDALEIEWVERGGTPVAPPSRKGFGSRLLQALIGGDLGGEAVLNYDPSGLVCRISAKL